MLVSATSIRDRPDIYKMQLRDIRMVSLPVAWFSGVILASGARGPGFNTQGSL